MKKYFLGVCAIALALGMSAFTFVSKRAVQTVEAIEFTTVGGVKRYYVVDNQSGTSGWQAKVVSSPSCVSETNKLCTVRVDPTLESPTPDGARFYFTIGQLDVAPTENIKIQ